MLAMALLLPGGGGPASAQDADFSEPWKNKDRALVVDAYEYNEIDWNKLASDKRIVGFINKASDGVSPPYICSGSEIEQRLCKTLWKRHAVARELYRTRRTVAKALGLKWGAYHLGRPGNPIEQANHFIDFADPQPDDLLAIDIEDNDPGQWMSLTDAEEFARHVKRRIGRYPVLYTNGSTAQHVADNRILYPLLSRLPLWYARYKAEIGMHFPKGNWESYALWQFSSQANCRRLRCPYRVPGTGNDIDVNVAAMDAAALRTAWPFGGLVDTKIDLIASVPVPLSREDGMKGDGTLSYAPVQRVVGMDFLRDAFILAGERYPPRPQPETKPQPQPVMEAAAVIDVDFTRSVTGVASSAQAALKSWLAASASLTAIPAPPQDSREPIRTGVPTSP
jgi:GH25 family lysozyme M1 (1,4-beta-N-acetylmuramidase)